MTVNDDLDKTLTVQDIVITGTVNIQVPGVYNLVYTLTDEAGNTRTVNRAITVSATPPPSDLDWYPTGISILPSRN
ncbi:MAG: DUF5011 domain-containing protein [Bacillus subtilis]|nr:DUF5011 domain-containing protein [Bacillus subtilis]